MKLKVGREYKTRQGDKALVCSIVDVNVGGCRYREAVVVIDKPDTVCFYLADADDGTSDIDNDPEHDLVADWKDPITKTVYVAMYRKHDGDVGYCAYPNITDAKHACSLFQTPFLGGSYVTITESV